MKKDIKLIIVKPSKGSYNETGLTDLQESLEQNYKITSSTVVKVSGYDIIIYTLEKDIEEPKVESLSIGEYEKYLELELNYYQRELKDNGLNPNLYEHFKQKVRNLKIILNK